MVGASALIARGGAVSWAVAVRFTRGFAEPSDVSLVAYARTHFVNTFGEFARYGDQETMRDYSPWHGRLRYHDEPRLRAHRKFTCSLMVSVEYPEYEQMPSWDSTFEYEMRTRDFGFHHNDSFNSEENDYSSDSEIEFDYEYKPEDFIDKGIHYMGLTRQVTHNTYW